MSTVVGILGVTHDRQLQKRMGYSRGLLDSLIREFQPNVLCGEVHPQSWKLYLNTGNAQGFLGETQDEYPDVVFPLCREADIKFVPVNWFEEDVFQEGIFDRFGEECQRRLQHIHDQWTERQLAVAKTGPIPLNSFPYDGVTRQLYEWLESVNPAVHHVVWTARHYVMVARVRRAIASHPGARILCVHGADHNYWYYQSLRGEPGIDLVYPLR